LDEIKESFSWLFPKMYPQPNTTDIQSLKDFVKGLNKKKLNSLIEELGEEPSPFSVYLDRSKEDWLRRYPDSGDDVYNFLHSQQQGIGILG
jgi:hypothetical protein